MIVLRLSEAQKSERTLRLRLEKEAEFLRKVGFQRIFSALVDAKRPLVGHAVSFDLLFALSHFHGPLPRSYPKLKEIVYGLFPSLFDTQFLASSDVFKFAPQDAGPGSPRQYRFGSKALCELHKVFADEAAAAMKDAKPTVEVTFAPGHDRYSPDCNAFHEAGYDAYITGCVFAHMAKEALGGDLSSWLNGRTTMWRSRNHFNLHGDDDEGVYVHTRGLKGRDTSYLKAAFGHIKVRTGKKSKALKDTDIEIRWIDDDSAFVILPEVCRDDITAMLRDRATAGSDVGGLTFTSWSDWLLETKEAGDEEVRMLLGKLRLTSGVEEPALKRAKISA